VRSTSRRGLTLFQLLVLLALLALLLVVLLPALLRARLFAARARSSNNMKQIGIALHNYHDTYNELPPGVDDNHFSVAAKILPYIEQDNVYKSIDFKKSVDDDANAAIRKTVIRTYLNPKDPIPAPNDKYGPTNYLFAAGTQVGLEKNDGAFYQNSKPKFASFTDGLSNTVWNVETLRGDGGTKATDMRRQHVALKAKALDGLKDDAGVEDWKDGTNIAGDRCASWMDGRFLQGLFNGRLTPNDEKPDVNCEGKGGVFAPRSLDSVILAGMADVSVRNINIKISIDTWRAALTIAGGEVLGPDF
jgi:hypothetical protein